VHDSTRDEAQEASMRVCIVRHIMRASCKAKVHEKL
jgi:hypothetical protein